MSDEQQNVVVVHEGSRRIMLVGDITHESVAQVIHAMFALNDQDGVNGEQSMVPIEFWIDSPGGSAQAAWALVDVMVNVIDADIVTVGFGAVASAAILPLLFGDARLVLPNTEAMIHGVSRDPQMAPGTYDAAYYARAEREFKTDKESVHYSNEKLVDALVERAGWNRAVAFQRVLDGHDHRFFGGRAIVEAGLADAVMGEEDDSDTIGEVIES